MGEQSDCGQAYVTSNRVYVRVQVPQAHPSSQVIGAAEVEQALVRGVGRGAPVHAPHMLKVFLRMRPPSLE